MPILRNGTEGVLIWARTVCALSIADAGMPKPQKGAGKGVGDEWHLLKLAILAKAGCSVSDSLKSLDSCFRRNDGNGSFAHKA